MDLQQLGLLISQNFKENTYCCQIWPLNHSIVSTESIKLDTEKVESTNEKLL
jgi:hypothetical protein